MRAYQKPQEHMKTHERREATYVCSVCSYECTSEDLYNKHLLTHKGEAYKPKPRPKQIANKQNEPPTLPSSNAWGKLSLDALAR